MPIPQTRCIVFSVGRSEETDARKAALSMFERFTDRARRVVVLAQDEARTLSHDYIGTQHILLGLIREDGGVAARALESLGIAEEAARRQVQEITGRGPAGPAEAGTSRSRRGPRRYCSCRCARPSRSVMPTSRPGHILLGLVREDDGSSHTGTERPGR